MRLWPEFVRRLLPACVAAVALTGTGRAQAAAPATAADVSITLQPTSELPVAAFRLVLMAPEAPRAIVVLLPGSNTDGRNLVDQPEWRVWAAAHRVALLGCFFQDPPKPDDWIENYVRAADGSGPALLDALGQLAAAAHQPAVAGLPLALVGASAGGEFAYEFTCWRPERVLAFVAHKGGVYFTHLAPPAARRVPGLFFIGGRDLMHRRLSLTGVWSMGRRADALWALVDEPDVGHDESAFAPLSRVFLDDVLGLRLPGQELRPAAVDAGWLIGAGLPAPCPVPRDPYGTTTTGWLPGRASAEAAQPIAPRF